MSEGPFRELGNAREARILALEQEISELRRRDDERPDRGRRWLTKKIERLTRENESLRRRLARAETLPRRGRLTDSNVILEWAVGALLLAGMIIGAVQNCSGH